MKRSTKTAALAGWLFGGAFILLAGDGIWTSEGPPHTQVFSLALGVPPRTLFAASYGLLRSTEVGVWTPIETPVFALTALAIDPSEPETIYVGGPSGLARSIDNGDHFDTISSISARCIAIDTAAPSTLYVGSDYTDVSGTITPGSVHKSRDGGRTWSDLKTSSLVDRIAALVLDPRRPGTVYAGAGIYYDYPGYPPAPGTQHLALIGTEDDGAHWSALLPGTGIFEVRALAIDPQSGTVYAGVGNSVFRSESFGAGWASFDIGRGLTVGGINTLIVDPSTPTTLYAGTNLAGVFRSLDGGSTWAPMNDGLVDDETLGYSGLWINSLVLNPADGVLRAGSENGIFAIRPASASPPCTPGPEHLCLLGGRYRATVIAQIPDWQRDFRVARGSVVQQADRFGSFSFPDFTGDPTFPEVVVKILDPGLGRGVWVFQGSLTSLPYILTITDTTTGQIETYTNDSQNHFCGGADTSAFFDDSPGPWDYASIPNPGRGALSDGESLHLLGGRFAVTLSAHSALHNRTESGSAVAPGDRYGYFSLPGFTGDPTFPEVYVKMVDARAVNGNFWFFHAALTSLEYTLTVTDTVTGLARTYAGTTPFCGAADTSAFAD